MIEDKKQFFIGFGLMVGFVVVLITFFSPVFGGQNGLNYLDNLYNSISKGSAYYIPKVKKDVEIFEGNIINVNLAMADRKQIEQTARLLRPATTDIRVNEKQIQVRGDLGEILSSSLADADAMYYNQGEEVSTKYGYDERWVLYNWWKALKEMEKDLKRQGKFKEATIVALVVNKTVESSYNYYKIEPQKISDRLGIVIISLLFYVVYTVWYGFAFMFMFQGWGMKLEH